MITFTILLLALSVLGVIVLFIMKAMGHPIKHSYVLGRLFFAAFGIAILLLGSCFRLKYWPYAPFFSVLFYVLGGQISLWSIGISSEILGNEPDVNASSTPLFEKGASSGLNYFFSLVMIGAAGFFTREIATVVFKYGETVFIKQVQDIGRLPEKLNWVIVTSRATDDFGKEIIIDIGVLWDPYRWVKGSTQYVAVDEDEKFKISIDDVIGGFQNDETRPIIAVGTASHENAKENPEEEINRAQARADKIVIACGSHFVNRPHIYSLNLGAFRSNKSYSVFSATERRVILLVVRKGEDSVNLTSGIRNALIKAREDQNFIFDARKYSLFDTSRFKVLPRLNF